MLFKIRAEEDVGPALEEFMSSCRKEVWNLKEVKALLKLPISKALKDVLKARLKVFELSFYYKEKGCYYLVVPIDAPLKFRFRGREVRIEKPAKKMVKFLSQFLNSKGIKAEVEWVHDSNRQ